MKSDWYLPDEGMVEGFRAIKNRKTKELALVGRFGEIWESKPGKLKAVITSSKIASRYAGKSGIKGDEFVIEFSVAELKTWVTRLKIPVTRPSNQLKWVL